MNHYEVLGVSPVEETRAIRRAYLAAARECHPDFHAGASAAVRERNAERMAALNQAWAVLGDADTRRAYDRDLSRRSDPGVARRAARETGEPKPPPGKGWTPRAGDDGWMVDFDRWASEKDQLAPEPAPTTGRRLMRVLPVGLLAIALSCFALGVILNARPLVALGAIALVGSIGLFVFLPMFEMTRGRRT